MKTFSRSASTTYRNKEVVEWKCPFFSYFISIESRKHFSMSFYFGKHWGFGISRGYRPACYTIHMQKWVYLFGILFSRYCGKCPPYDAEKRIFFKIK